MILLLIYFPLSVLETIDMLLSFRLIIPGLNSGNLQALVYDLRNEWVYIAYEYITETVKKIDADKRPFIGLNLKELFSVPLWFMIWLVYFSLRIDCDKRVNCINDFYNKKYMFLFVINDKDENSRTAFNKQIYNR